jgi:hypothetical protein
MEDILRHYPLHSDDATWQEVGEEIIILDVDSGAYFGVQGTGARIWQLADGALTGDEIARRLVDEYEVELEDARSDVRELLGYLVENGLLVCRESPAQHPPSEA